jgi:hypothetical protein
MVRPSLLTSMLDGYQPVGMSPRKRDGIPFAPASYTATAFAPPRVT